MDPQVASLLSFFRRELSSLRREIQAYPVEEMIWRVPPGIPNSGGTLALHLTGNLRHYIGAVLGGSGYVRDRDAEFSDRGIPRSDLLARIAAAEREVEATLPRLGEDRLTAPFPEALRGQVIETREALLQFAVHLAYHLGQLSYHRRAVTGDPTGVGALDPASLSTALPTGDPA